MKIEQYGIAASEGEVDETLDSLVNGEYPLNIVTEDADNYYIKQRRGEFYHLMWAINKKTGKSTCLDLLDYMHYIEDQTTKVDPPYDRLKIGS